jgi:FixJ family two-component response regulator
LTQNLEKTVGVVDDDPEIRRAMKSILSAYGYKTCIFDSAEAFLRSAPTSKAKCLVVDVQLGEMSGVELVRQLKDLGFTFPTIFMTGLDDETVRTQALQLGCVDYLRKPFPANLLIEALERVMA